MKTKHMLLSILPLLALLAGCATDGPQKPPTPTEYKFFDIQTNQVPVVTATKKTEVVTDPVTNLPRTNVVTVYATNVVDQYVFKPNALAEETAATTGLVGSLTGPGGGLAGTIVGGIFAIGGALRSRRSNQAAAALAQIIETGQQVLLTVPNGAELASQWKAWMIKHQAETGTITQVSKLVANIVDTDDARQVAEHITELIRKAHDVPTTAAK